LKEKHGGLVGVGLDHVEVGNFFTIMLIVIFSKYMVVV
jgi:hypothetical protein